MFSRLEKLGFPEIKDTLRLIYGIKIDFFSDQKLDFVDGAIIVVRPVEDKYKAHYMKYLKLLANQGL